MLLEWFEIDTTVRPSSDMAPDLFAVSSLCEPMLK